MPMFKSSDIQYKLHTMGVDLIFTSYPMHRPDERDITTWSYNECVELRKQDLKAYMEVFDEVGLEYTVIPKLVRKDRVYMVFHAPYDVFYDVINNNLHEFEVLA